MEALLSYETSVLTRAPRRNTPEDGNLHSYRRKNLKALIGIILQENQLMRTYCNDCTTILNIYIYYMLILVNEELLERKVAAPV
jgi:hypothetical protein